MKSKDKDYYRLRVGDIRVLFRVIEENKTVWITDMGFRGSVYE
jgi:mRNA-degrading endonuclease RelE of RelBE toxin-antitoxin system